MKKATKRAAKKPMQNNVIDASERFEKTPPTLVDMTRKKDEDVAFSDAQKTSFLRALTNLDGCFYEVDDDL